MHRRALSVLFLLIAVALGAIALYSALSGGRAWVIAITAAGLAAWMADMARRAWP